MNETRSDSTSLGAAVGLKAALLIGLVGLIVAITEHSHLAPSAVEATAGTRLSAAGDGSRIAAERDAGERGSIGSTVATYPALSPDAVSDEGGHPPSF